jgi:hypothetical protein
MPALSSPTLDVLTTKQRHFTCSKHGWREPGRRDADQENREGNQPRPVCISWLASVVPLTPEREHWLLCRTNMIIQLQFGCSAGTYCSLKKLTVAYLWIFCDFDIIYKSRLVCEVKLLSSLSRSIQSIKRKLVAKIITRMDRKLRDESTKSN